MFLRASDIKPKNFDTVLATSVVAGHKTVISLSLSHMVMKLGIKADILPKKQFLLRVNV